MVSLRFPFLFSQPHSSKPRLPSHSASRPCFAAAAAFATVAAGAATFAGLSAAAAKDPANSQHSFLQTALNLLFPNSHLPAWASLSLADNSASSDVVDSKTGFLFPSVLHDSQKLLGIGLRRKTLFGLKNIDVYVFGVYADNNDVKQSLAERYRKLTVSELGKNKGLSNDLIEGDINMTVRLQIVYGKLSIRSVRSAFEESVGSRLQKFGGSNDKELLQRFTSQFKDEYKIPRGSVIELSRGRGCVLRTTIDGKEIGSIQSELLCRSVLDLYIGEDPFDKQAKQDIELSVASLLEK